MNRKHLAGAVTGLAFLMAADVAVTASPPPAPPSNVRIIDASVTNKRAGFTIAWDPAPGRTTYQIITDPKPGCRYTGTTPGPGAFPTKSFTKGPYQVHVECNCGYRFVAKVSTAPPDAYTSRSTWTSSAGTQMTCVRP